MFGGVKNSEKIRSELLNLLPDAEVLSLVLHSVVNLWGVSYYEKGRKVRSVAGSSDDGIICDIGEKWPEEINFLGGRDLEYLNAVGEGEDLVFEITKRFFGCRFDEVNDFSQPVVSYKKKLFPFF